MLKGIIRPEEWDTIRQQIDYDFQNDNHFTELKEAEMIKERLGLLDQIDQYVGRYYSKDYVRRHVLKMSEEDLQYMDKQMDKEGDDTMSPDLKSKELGLQQQQQELEMQAKETGAPPTAKQESVESTEEEKELLESMTRFMDSITEED